MNEKLGSTIKLSRLEREVTVNNLADSPDLSSSIASEPRSSSTAAVSTSSAPISAPESSVFADCAGSGVVSVNETFVDPCDDFY